MNEDNVWSELASISADPPETRDKCQQCKRPVQVCWCPGLPKHRLNPASRIVILQHPAEAKRCLRTVPMLTLALESGKCLIFRAYDFPGRFSSHSSSPLPPCLGAYNFSCQAIYHSSPALYFLRACKLIGVPTSEYVIRTQPTEGCLSTLETGASALSILEGDPELRKKMLGPLHYLCRFQLENGAVTHQSKEFLIKQKTYPKLIGKRLAKQLRILPDSTA
ncbi:PREDICTED: DTW domain-containing protein 2 isoform X2 [Atta colombica]|uniref:DTW domain-containing protein 2 isoform X2 n=1 Tax=Atta colombica TaxID=520822 RepID=UPI00084CAC4B|nr:PREDICTED: DTW domain-containing protein 2 isoform X2 [Atta colombica]